MDVAIREVDYGKVRNAVGSRLVQGPLHGWLPHSRSDRRYHRGPRRGGLPAFKPLVEKTAQNFTIKQLAADKAYLSRENLQQVHDLGGAAYIPFKSNSVPGEAGTLWEKLYHFYSMHRDEFDKRYHVRSQVESVFSMIKAKFRDGLRSRSNVAMKNEVLAKIVAHNVCCLIMSQIELGIDVQFWGEPTADAAPEPTAAVVGAAPVVADEPADEPAPVVTPARSRALAMCGA